jgi:aminopeptidase N
MVPMSSAEITRAETAERARLLQVDSYDIMLDLTRGTELFGSATVIRFSCRVPGASTYVDLVAAAVHQITLNGQRVDPADAFADGRITLAGLAGRNELTVIADCRYSSDGTGFHRSVDSADGKIYSYTKFEPAYARTVYANFEQPDLKAAFTLTVIAPAHWRVLSNQPATAPEPSPWPEASPGPGGPSAIWRFQPTPRISTYLTAVAAGEFHVVSSSHTTARGQVVPVTLACRASLASQLETADILLITGQGLDFYTGLFGSDYPFVKYDQVFVPGYSAGATENVGCVIISDELLFPSPGSHAQYELRAEVILHEMAHMWFGDLVTMKWWGDLWLNESFAEYGGMLASAEATRFTDAWTTFCIRRKAWGYEEDQLPSTHPVAADVETVSQAVANFDGISYAKGAALLRQLEALVGRDNFLAGIRAYFAAHAWQNATLTDLLSAVEASAGASLADWSKAWLETAGPNTLRTEFETGPDGAFTSFTIVQEAPADHPVLRPHHLAIGLYERAGRALTRVRRVEADITGGRTRVPELAGVRQPDLILLNDDDLDYAIVRFDPRSISTLTESIGLLASSLSRAVCWSAVIDMARQAELPARAFIRMLAGGIGQETAPAVLRALSGQAQRLMAELADPGWLPAAKQELAAAAIALLQKAQPGSDRLPDWAQLASWTATAPEQLDLLAGLLAGGAAIPGLTVDAELRWAILRRLAATGRAGDAEIDAELGRDATDTGRRHAAAARAAIGDAGHKEAAWQLLTQAGGLGAADISEIAVAFMQPEQAAVLAPYTERYFQALPEIWMTFGAHTRVRVAQLLFPHPAPPRELLARVDAFLAAGPWDPSLERVLAERRDVVTRALRARAAGPPAGRAAGPRTARAAGPSAGRTSEPPAARAAGAPAGRAAGAPAGRAAGAPAGRAAGAPGGRASGLPGGRAAEPPARPFFV